MNTYTWEIQAFKVKRNEGELVNVVYQIQFLYRATDGEFKTFVSDVASIGGPDEENYTEYENLTQDQVVEWLESSVDVDALKIVSDGVNAQRNVDNAIVVITHYQRLLDYIVPDFVHILSDGNIIKSGGPELALEVEKNGYAGLINAA